MSERDVGGPILRQERQAKSAPLAARLIASTFMLKLPGGALR
jgi:hypothetical protein